MEILPAIKDFSIPRPGPYSGACPHFVPNPDEFEFWTLFYQQMKSQFVFNPPFVNAENTINKYFGYFGLRYHPVKKIGNYFHTGIDFDGKTKTPITPITKGILEYSGFGLINGKYIMLSHPEIRTKDGFVLHSLYLHLRDLKISFTSYQKMLREVSFNSYPLIEIGTDKTIGLLGQTGNAKGYPHLHLQLEFRNEKGDIILIDPVPVMGIPPGESLTKDIKDESEYSVFLQKNKDQMAKTNLKEFIRETY